VLKHAKAKQLELVLTFGPDAVSLTIADDGAGFDPGEHHDGFGLLGMHERAERIGAKLQVSSRSPSGTLVETILPKSALSRD
jgi:two-component system sensor histidine kinase UhpB